MRFYHILIVHEPEEMVSDSHQGGKNDLTGTKLGKIVRRMFRDVDHVGKLEIGNKSYMLPVVYSTWQCNQLICRLQIYSWLAKGLRKYHGCFKPQCFGIICSTAEDD